MVTITFIYKIKHVNNTFYGKYITDYVSDDHEGLDKEIKYRVLDCINKYRASKNIKKLESKNFLVGVLSCTTNDNFLDYYSNQEIKCFDFYYKKINYNTQDVYINGKKLT